MQQSGEATFIIPDAMVLKQLLVTPWILQSGNDGDTTIVVRLWVENFGVMTLLASVTYKNGSPDTSPPPSNPMAPETSLGEVWDIGKVLLEGTKIQIDVTHTRGVNPTLDSFRVSLIGTWLRDV